jgi:hypothetical protein
MVLLFTILIKIRKDMYILKQECVGQIMEIIREDIRLIFDTNIEPEDRYEYFYNHGFNWAFEPL